MKSPIALRPFNRGPAALGPIDRDHVALGRSTKQERLSYLPGSEHRNLLLPGFIESRFQNLSEQEM